MDETYVKIAGRSRYVYRGIDQYGQTIDVYVSPRRDTRAARRFFAVTFGPSREPPARGWLRVTLNEGGPK